MTANDLMMQIQADILGIQVVRPVMKESTALGAAVAAGFGIGAWDTELLKNRPCETFLPAITSESRDAIYARWKRAIPRAKGWASSEEPSSPPPSPPAARRRLVVGGAVGLGFILGVGVAAIAMWRRIK